MSFSDELARIRPGEVDFHATQGELNEVIKYFQKRCKDAAQQGKHSVQHGAEVFNPDPDGHGTCAPLLRFPTKAEAEANAAFAKDYLLSALKELGFLQYDVQVSVSEEATAITRSFFGLFKRKYGIYYRLNIELSASWG